ncbi:hypothetical protein C8Q80DRAFT_1351008 [Daedaleopsis nitida]|nr:hypothetical protein C8Q80DRAFT_1351008 [Daedaleopsis nitida]
MFPGMNGGPKAADYGARVRFLPQCMLPYGSRYLMLVVDAGNLTSGDVFVLDVDPDVAAHCKAHLEPGSLDDPSLQEVFKSYAADVDLVVLSTDRDQESLKRMLVEQDSLFYLVPSKNPRATYEVLWYSLSDSTSRYYGSLRALYDCHKVDILNPGVMNIPLLPQLLLKLQAWSDHRASHRANMRAKQHVDVRDIDLLLDIAVRKAVRIRAEDTRWVPETMITEAQGRVLSYTMFASQKTSAGWKTVGFALCSIALGAP